MIIHIAEANSNQIVEVSGENLREMLCAYWTRNRWNKDRPYNFVSTGTNGHAESVTFMDSAETLELREASWGWGVYFADWTWNI